MSVPPTSTTTVLRPFVQDYPGEPVPEKTLSHPPSWSSSNLYQLLPSTTIHSILPVQIACLAIFLHHPSISMSFWVYFLVWSPPPHIPYISSPNQWRLFATHAHTIATCVAAVSILYHLFLVFLSTPYLELCLSPYYTSIWPLSSLLTEENIAGRFFGLVTKHACDRRTVGQTDRITTPKTVLA